MRRFVFVLVLLLAGAAGWFLLPHATPRLGRPIVVDGQRIDDEEIQRWLIYGPCRARLEARRTRFLVEAQLERLASRAALLEIEQRESTRPWASAEEREQALVAVRTAAHARLSESVAVADEELEREYARTVEEFLRRNPALDLEAEIGRTYRRSDWFRDELRLGLAFDKLFFPSAPAEWPEETWSALEYRELELRDPRDLTRRSVHETFAGRDWRELRHESPEVLAGLRETLRRRLLLRAHFETALDGMTPGIVLTARSDDEGCSDLVVRTSELWSEVEDTIEAWEIEAARQWLATTLATRGSLEAQGGMELRAVRERVVADLRDRAERNGIGLEELAATADRFPSPEAWVEYQVLREAFRERVHRPASMEPGQERSARVERSSWQHAGGRVHVEILLVSAADIPHNRWPAGGFEVALKKASALREELETNARAWTARRDGRSKIEAVEPFVHWNRMLDEHSDWWDPPDPREGENPRPPRNHGRFYGRTWSELRTLLSESDATDWAEGTAISEQVFFTQSPGTISGPLRCALGWVLVRLGARQPPEQQLDPESAIDRELLLEDDLRERFAEYARAARRRAGLETGER